MEIKLDLKLFLFFIIFIFIGYIDIYLLFIIFALIHEIGHIMPIGFSIYFNTNIDDYNKKILKGNKYVIKNLLIAIAGPLTNILIFIITFFINLVFENKSCYKL